MRYRCWARTSAVSCSTTPGPSAPPEPWGAGKATLRASQALAETLLTFAAAHLGVQAEVVFDCATNGPQHHSFEGPLLRDVVLDAHPVFGARGRKDRSRYLVAVTGGDGHHTVLSRAEVDADFGNVPALLATGMDGRGLDAAGSRLVMPADRCGARYISAITHVWAGVLPVSVQPARCV
ncbi:molybdopterin-dependent oxidoreductase [Streptomyces sp. NPDC091387]|uniref:molybdopterin-dependent oxidoreductase n=1 Tax=Streptomyces sp. NPDC091387 TaxID=3365998 RepID=UPI00381018E5